MSWENTIKGQRPDYPDLDGDGDTDEPMVDALETVEQVESVKKEAVTMSWENVLKAEIPRRSYESREEWEKRKEGLEEPEEGPIEIWSKPPNWQKAIDWIINKGFHRFEVIQMMRAMREGGQPNNPAAMPFATFAQKIEGKFEQANTEEEWDKLIFSLDSMRLQEWLNNIFPNINNLYNYYIQHGLTTRDKVNTRGISQRGNN